MATRAVEKLQHAQTLTLTPNANIAEGKPVKYGSSDTTCVAAGAGEMPIGWTETALLSGVPGTVIISGGIKEVNVDASGATRGKSQVIGSGGGIQDAPTAGGGTTAYNCVGFAVQSGSSGDKVGLLIHPHVILAA